MAIQQITEELEPWVTRIIRGTVDQHILHCPVAPRVAKLELRFGILVGYMLGAGFIGGAGSALLIKLLG